MASPPPPGDAPKPGVFSRLAEELRRPTTGDYIAAGDETVHGESSPASPPPSAAFDLRGARMPQPSRQGRPTLEQGLGFQGPDGGSATHYEKPYQAAFKNSTFFGEKAEQLAVEASTKFIEAHPWVDDDYTTWSARPLPEVPLSDWAKDQVWMNREATYANLDDMVPPDSWQKDRFPPEVEQEMKEYRYRNLAQSYQTVRDFAPKLRYRVKGVGPQDLNNLVCFNAHYRILSFNLTIGNV